MSGTLQSAFFFGYMLLACWVFFLMMAAVGYWSALAFVRQIYKNFKSGPWERAHAWPAQAGLTWAVSRKHRLATVAHGKEDSHDDDDESGRVWVEVPGGFGAGQGDEGRASPTLRSLYISQALAPPPPPHTQPAMHHVSLGLDGRRPALSSPLRTMRMNQYVLMLKKSAARKMPTEMVVT
jgi:hypothetical protein